MTLRLAGLAALAVAGSATAAWCGEAQDYSVKAAFLYRFASFVQWPAQAFADPAAPLTLCVVGHDPFGHTIDRTVRGQTVAARPVVVRRMTVVTAGAGCHIAYLGGSEEQSPLEAVTALAAAPVLTVTDSAAPDNRGAVNFVVQGGRVRFQIDQRQAAHSGLSISSKLLNLALEVVR